MYQLHIAIYATLYSREPSQANSSQQALSFETEAQAEKALDHLSKSYLAEGYTRSITRLYDPS
ncbi:hypothetical protein [Delftia phage PhiW-14]|uniref:Uncharacterized protein n=1 Tax=Delftia phage PhiW-14 TaxID=665032 RepID=C9DGA8_BPW14|nr:hypothetical protein DP-phiW-14_gp138 [Delftia phage PhiW-14]ACV50159.1 hypothetical protein [Delftia phage PhiW-14]